VCWVRMSVGPLPTPAIHSPASMQLLPTLRSSPSRTSRRYQCLSSATYIGLIVLGVVIVNILSIELGLIGGPGLGQGSGARAGRRGAMVGGVSSAIVICGKGLLAPQSSPAFDNRLQVKLEPFPKTPGPQPKDLGLRSDGSLKGCDFVKPNCFSSSANPEDIEGDLYKSYLIPKFKFSKPKSEAFQDVLKVLENYEVGHDNIDGGGFKIVKKDGVSGYVYVQYESLKKGYIDDFEIALGNDGTASVRTASRLGFLDLGVNAKRINYIANKLNSVGGWEAPKVSSSSHPNYFNLNRV